jgi:hypothetical protein
MQTPLPSKNQQRKLKFRPTKDQIKEIFALLNEHVFEGKLKQPSINLRSMEYLGLCTGYDDPDHHVKIRLTNGFFCIQWFIMILAHEMAHQYQWVIHGPRRVAQKRIALLSHGKSFFEFREQLTALGIPLKSEYSTYKWMKHQDLKKI